MTDIISEMDLDLDFLEEEASFDVDHFASRPGDLFSFTAILICNDEPDIQTMEYFSDYELAAYIHKEFDDDAIQTIVKNNHEESKSLCPYFRIIMEKYSADAPINFKLHGMFIKMGIQSLSSRCVKAMLVGLTTFSDLQSPINVPYCFMSANIDPLDFIFEDIPELDMACLKTCDETTNAGANDLCDIAGMPMPYLLPWECQFKILSYLRNPLAEMVTNKIDQLCFMWDVFLYPMFQQREPRIPFHIASFYNATTVLSTAEAATRPFLVRPVLRKEPSALPSWMTSL